MAAINYIIGMENKSDFYVCSSCGFPRKENPVCSECGSRNFVKFEGLKSKSDIYWYTDKNGKRKRYYYCCECRKRFKEHEYLQGRGIKNYGTRTTPILYCDACSQIKMVTIKSSTSWGLK